MLPISCKKNVASNGALCCLFCYFCYLILFYFFKFQFIVYTLLHSVSFHSILFIITFSVWIRFFRRRNWFHKIEFYLFCFCFFPLFFPTKQITTFHSFDYKSNWFLVDLFFFIWKNVRSFLFNWKRVLDCSWVYLFLLFLFFGCCFPKSLYREKMKNINLDMFNKNIGGDGTESTNM